MFRIIIRSSSVNILPTEAKVQLQSTNMSSYQDGDILYIIGGYGFSLTENDHITYPYSNIINIPNLINVIQNKQSNHLANEFTIMINTIEFVYMDSFITNNLGHIILKSEIWSIQKEIIIFKLLLNKIQNYYI
jgi:hypothetical protein